jgi:NADH-quinone oxidoreductase subunit N
MRRARRVLRLVAPAVCAGAAGPDTVAFGGQFRADAFAGFAKLMIYAASGAALVVAPRFFGRLGAMRAEYLVLVLFAALGMSVMVSAGDLITLYIGLELNSLAAYVLAAFLRTDTRSAEAGLKYFVLGALASGILLFGMSLTYGFTGTTGFDGIRAALDGDLSTGAMFGLVFVLAGLAFKIAACRSTCGPRRLRRLAHAGRAVLRQRPQGRGGGAADAGGDGCVRQPGDAWRPGGHLRRDRLDRVGALGAIGQANIKRFLAVFVDQQRRLILIGLATATQAGASAMLIYLAIYVPMTVGSFVAC